MEKTINILIGGKLGDFFITLQGVKGLCKSRNVKANISGYYYFPFSIFFC